MGAFAVHAAGLSSGGKAFPFSIHIRLSIYGGVGTSCSQMLPTLLLWSLLVLGSTPAIHNGTGLGTGTSLQVTHPVLMPCCLLSSGNHTLIAG